jgi:hypothetical protein
MILIAAIIRVALVQVFVTALILYNAVVPISLYVTLELVKYAQASTLRGIVCNIVMLTFGRWQARQIDADALMVYDPTAVVSWQLDQQSFFKLNVLLRC